VLSRIEKIDVSNLIAASQEAAEEVVNVRTAYLRNSTKHIWGMFVESPTGLESLQDVNLYLIDKLGRGAVSWVTREDFIKNAGEDAYKIGNLRCVDTLSRELVYFFNMKGTKYVAEVERLSALTKKVILIGCRMQLSKESQKLDAYIPPATHAELQQLIQSQPDKLVYKLILQTITLIGCTNQDSETANPCTKILRDMLGGKDKTMALKRTIADAGRVEPFHLWQSVTSVAEREALIQRAGENFFKTQRQLIDEFRRSKVVGASAKALADYTEKVKKIFPSAVFAILYGRMKLYNAARKEHAADLKKAKKTQRPLQLSYKETVELLQKKEGQYY
jgi:hypothetical protein